MFLNRIKSMSKIPEHLIDNFLTELSMYSRHLECVLNNLDELEQKMLREFNRIKNNYNPEETDEGEVWAQALENVLGVDTNFGPWAQKIGAILGYCIIVFHLFERFLEGASIFKERVRIDSFDKFIKRHAQFKDNLAHEKIYELRLLVNYSKHGIGPAEKELRIKRPDYFERGRIVFLGYSKPLSGYDVKIKNEDFHQYVEAIKSFVDEIHLQWG